MTKRIAIIGAGPSGWHSYAPFNLPPTRASRFPRLSVTKSRMTGAVCGITAGVPDWMPTASRSMAACIATCGRMAPRSASSSPTTPLKNISGALSPPIRRVRCYSTTSRDASRRPAYASTSASAARCARSPSMMPASNSRSACMTRHSIW